jgi:hypothetical protein
MRTGRARRIGRQETEQLLTGAAVEADREGLAGLLALAAGPVRPDELAGRADAVRAFVRAPWQPAPTVAPAPRTRALSLLTRAAAVKLAAALGVLLVAGTAVAAGTGRLPAGAQHRAHDLLNPLGIPVPDARRAPGPASGSPGNHAGTGTVPGGAASPSAGEDAAGVRGLCQAWSVQRDHPESAAPALVEHLGALAGGTGNIPAYCATVLGSTPTPAATPTPHPGAPDATPSHPGGGKGQDHPTVSDHPTPSPDHQNPSPRH